jgi:hypothetical protein
MFCLCYDTIYFSITWLMFHTIYRFHLHSSSLFLFGSLFLFSFYFFLLKVVFSSVIYFRRFKNEVNESKRRFYLMLFILFTPWMIFPALGSIFTLILSPWVKDIIVTGLTVTATGFAYAVVTLLFWHKRAPLYFSISTPDVATLLDSDYSMLLNN